MRYAIFSDIHANWQAWQAVLADIEANGCDVLVCLGDAVGYGPSPREVLTSVRERAHAFVLGNHDAAACGRLDSALFNENAQAGIVHTRAMLDRDSLDYLSGIPYATEVDDILFVHAEVEAPDRFDYVETAAKARADFAASGHRCVFLGHTHIPTTFVKADGFVRQKPDEDFRFLPGQRYIVNVGSVGEPRNPEDIRARYVIFDKEEGVVYFRRVEFDTEAYRADLAASGSAAYPFFLQILDFDAEVREFTEALAHDMRAAVASDAGVRIERLHLPDLSTVHEVSREVRKKSARVTFLIFLLLIAAMAAGWFGYRHFDPERRDRAADPLGIAGAPALAVEAAGVPEGEALFAYWPMDSGTEGYAGSAAFQGFGVGRPGRGEGRYGGAVRLDASSGLVFGKNRTYAIRDDSFTVSFWARFTDPPRGGIRLLGNGARGKIEPGWLITLEGDRLRFFLGSGANRAQIGGRQPALIDGGWHHLAMVRDAGAGTMRTYVDGDEIGSLDVSRLGDRFPAAHSLAAGFLGDAGGLEGWGGMLDELAIWRRALGAEEIRAIAGRGDALKAAFGEPVKK